MEDNFFEFFPDNSIKGSKFYFYCPNMTNEDKILIINMIKEKGGVRLIFIFVI